LIFDFFLWRGLSINIPWKIYYWRQNSWPLEVYVKGIARAFNWLKSLGGFLHLKPTAGCQISTLIFDFFYEGGASLNIPWTIYYWRQNSWPLEVYVKGIARAFNWLKSLGGFLHLKPTAGCQISTLIFDFFLWRGLSITIPWKIY
jgi:accessory gene regulator protein AgrB